jgi:aspartate ammonia-lyase
VPSTHHRNTEALGASVESFIGLVTAQPEHIGSTEAIDIAKEALAAGRCVAQFVQEEGPLRAGRLADLLRAKTVAGSRQALVRDAR